MKRRCIGPWKPEGFLLLLALGCTTYPPGEFPIGLYDVPASRFSDVASAGFNLVVTSPSKATLDAAQSNGLKVWAHPGFNGELSGNGPATVRAFDQHPALWGWYLVDEPDLHRISPRKVASLNTRLKQNGRKPGIVVVASGSAVEKYRNSADAVAVDWYPVSWGPLATITREMRLARVAQDDRPFYAILQAFNWSAFPELLHTEVPLRAPSAAEIRCAAYLSLMQGAAGILFYTYETEKWKLYEHPDIWAAVSDVAREVRQNAAIFHDRIEWWPAQTESHGPPTEMYNEIMEAKVVLALFHVKKAARDIAAGYYLIAANSSNSPTDFSFKVPFSDVREFDTFCAMNEFKVDAGWVRKTYAPFEICIFGPINAQLMD